MESSNIFTNSKRVFICASVLNAKGIITEVDEDRYYRGQISETENYCSPIEVTNFENPNSIKDALESLITVICLACGVKHKITSIIEAFN